MEIIDFDFRQRFKDNWNFPLAESPLQQSPIDSNIVLHDLETSINAYKDMIANGEPLFSETKVGDLYKIGSDKNLIYYQLDANNELTFGIRLEKKGEHYFVTLVAKTSNNPNYVSNLYLTILKDLNARLLSDNKLTLGGFSIWERLLSSGADIGVYEPADASNSFKLVKTFEELKSYFGTDKNNPKFTQTRFVLGLHAPIIEAWEQFLQR